MNTLLISAISATSTIALPQGDPSRETPKTEAACSNAVVNQAQETDTPSLRPEFATELLRTRSGAVTSNKDSLDSLLLTAKSLMPEAEVIVATLNDDENAPLNTPIFTPMNCATWENTTTTKPQILLFDFRTRGMRGVQVIARRQKMEKWIQAIRTARQRRSEKIITLGYSDSAEGVLTRMFSHELDVPFLVPHQN